MNAIVPSCLALATAALLAACDQSPKPTPEPAPTTAPSPQAEESPAGGGVVEAQEPTQPSALESGSPPPEVAPVVTHAPAATAAPKVAALKPTATATATAEAPATAEQEPEPPPRKVSTVRGSSHAADSFALSIQAPSPVRQGETASATIVLSAKAPFKCNLKYPYKFTLDAPGSGVSYPTAVVRSMSIAEKTSTMSVPFSATQKGKGTVSGTLSFSVCTDDKCLIEKRPLAVTVNID
ncbi:MAG: hypothetical protein KF718_07365 [Polyangiaceae bacterium]|nr:hypothetical protein [Polyangiaceae bacterium]